MDLIILKEPWLLPILLRRNKEPISGQYRYQILLYLLRYNRDQVLFGLNMIIRLEIGLRLFKLRAVQATCQNKKKDKDEKENEEEGEEEEVEEGEEEEEEVEETSTKNHSSEWKWNTSGQ